MSRPAKGRRAQNGRLLSSRRWLQCFSRKYNQTRSTGLISGEYGGSQTSATLLGVPSRMWWEIVVA
jgi:hypothetical protein